MKHRRTSVQKPCSLAGLTRLVLAACSLACFTHCNGAEPELVCSPDGAANLYQRRIEPILRDDRPTSCNQCHLAGIDLSLFVRDTPCQTMACMAELGLVDLARPESSTVLQWIGRAKPQSSLITAEVIQQEHAGFLEWIEYSASCNAQVCPPFADPCGQNMGPSATRCTSMTSVGGGFVDSGDCRELTLEQVFATEVYSWRDRCSPCHFSSDTLVTAPKWISDASDSRTSPELSCATGSLETMRNVLRGGYIDLTDPPKSLLLQKPLSVEGGGVLHGGGPKFEGQNDPSYKTFLAFIQRYASCAAQDPTLPRPAPPPPQSTAPIGDPHATAPPVAAAPEDRTTFIDDYCNCVLRNCHDASHAKWGMSDDELLAGCKAESAALPPSGAPTTSGNFVECRAAACQQAATDPDACIPALGDAPCL